MRKCPVGCPFCPLSAESKVWNIHRVVSGRVRTSKGSKTVNRVNFDQARSISRSAPDTAELIFHRQADQKMGQKAPLRQKKTSRG